MQTCAAIGNTVLRVNSRPYSLGTVTSVSPTAVQTSAPANSGDRPRRANAPARRPSTGRIRSAAYPLGSRNMPIDPRPAARSPYHGPKRMAIGSVTTRPSVSGTTAVKASELTSSPTVPHRTVIARRDNFFEVSTIVLARLRACPLTGSPNDTNLHAATAATPERLCTFRSTAVRPRRRSRGSHHSPAWPACRIGRRRGANRSTRRRAPPLTVRLRLCAPAQRSGTAQFAPAP